MNSPLYASLWPLHYYASHGNFLNFCIQTQATYQIKLFLSFTIGITETVQCAIEDGADVNERDKSGDTPLHWAASHGNSSKLLFKNSSNKSNHSF